ncbi:MAG: hypothetical protein QOH25_523 [Acidobacteriota bacterium]|jgi:hypothetical protein|nr:hypothetical protein [Acidobacteriota bacterium]
MGVKEKFTAEEWRTLLKAPMLVSYAIAGAAPSDEDGYIQEMKAVADAISESEQRAAKDSLISEVVANIIANAEDNEYGQTEKISVSDVKGRALANCQEVAGLLQTKVSAEEADDYKRWLLGVAQRVAGAAKEGGIFGFGGAQVSKTEVATINEIAAALGVQA